jgi:hypothetical protein
MSDKDRQRGWLFVAAWVCFFISYYVLYFMGFLPEIFATHADGIALILLKTVAYGGGFIALLFIADDVLPGEWFKGIGTHVWACCAIAIALGLFIAYCIR